MTAINFWVRRKNTLCVWKSKMERRQRMDVKRDRKFEWSCLNDDVISLSPRSKRGNRIIGFPFLFLSFFSPFSLLFLSFFFLLLSLEESLFLSLSSHHLMCLRSQMDFCSVSFNRKSTECKWRMKWEVIRTKFSTYPLPGRRKKIEMRKRKTCAKETKDKKILYLKEEKGKEGKNNEKKLGRILVTIKSFPGTRTQRKYMTKEWNTQEIFQRNLRNVLRYQLDAIKDTRTSGQINYLLVFLCPIFSILPTHTF